MKNKIIFVDIDGTLVEGQSQILYLKYLHSHGQLKTIDLINSFFWLLKYKYFSSGIDIGLAEKMYSLILKNKDKNDLENELELFFEESLVKKIFPTSKEIIDKHRKEGKLIILTSMPEMIARIYSKYFDIAEVEATEFEVVNDRYTGRILRPLLLGSQKAEIINLYNKNYKTTFLSDNESDILALKCVNEPIVVNPTRRLNKFAKKNNWKIIKL